MFVLSSSLRTPDSYLLKSPSPRSSSPPAPAPWGSWTSYQPAQELTLTSRCCIQQVSKSGKPRSGYRVGKGQSSSQFPRRVVLKNVLTIRELHSSPMLVRSCLKSYILVFSIMQNQKLLDVQAEFRKGRGTRNQIANICWIIEKLGNPPPQKKKKKIYLCFIN